MSWSNYLDIRISSVRPPHGGVSWSTKIHKCSPITAIRPPHRGMSWNCCSRTTRRWNLFPCFRAKSSELSAALLGFRTKSFLSLSSKVFPGVRQPSCGDGWIQCPTPLGTPFHCAPPTISNHSLLQSPPLQEKGRREGQSVSQLSRHCSACNRNSGAWVTGRGSDIIIHDLNLSCY